MKLYRDIVLDRKASIHLYVQLYNKLKTLIEEGRLKPHTKLPAIRKMANQLDVNNVTVVNAYKLLEQQDYVYKKVGSGTFIKDIDINNTTKNILIDDETNLYNKEAIVMDKSHIKINNKTINFASGIPTSNLFPVSDFKTVLNEVLDRDKGNAFGYQESQGYFPLRETIKDYIGTYGIKTEVDNIQVISGAQQGIDILSKTLIDYGDIVFTESPTYTGAIASFQSRSARIVEIPILEDGIDIKTLENKLRVFNPKFIYLMPNFQNPTGFSYSMEKKEKILELAVKFNFFVIEDDYLSDLSFNDRETQPLKAIDTENRVIYIKSFSKIFMPGLRLAFMVNPISIYSEVLSAKHTSDISTSGLIQRAFQLYLEKGIWQKHIKYMEAIYRDRFDVMVDSLKKYMPEEVSYKIPSGGLNFWICLPKGYSSNDLYDMALKNNIVFVPGSVFTPEGKDSNYLRLSIASLYKNEIPKGIEKLSSLIISYLDSTKKINQTSYKPLL